MWEISTETMVAAAHQLRLAPGEGERLHGHNWRIKATVRATERLQLLKTGLLVGEVHAPAFSMEDGAKFQGMSDMGVASWGDEAQKLPGNVRDISSQRPKAVAMLGENA